MKKSQTGKNENVCPKENEITATNSNSIIHHIETYYCLAIRF